MEKLKVSLAVVCFTAFFISVAQASNFWDNFDIYYGWQNVQYPGPQVGEAVTLGLTQQTGSGFRSYHPYLFGSFSLKMKVPSGNTAGTVTSFYMASTYKNWSALDFELLGNVTGQPYTLQTNVFVEGKGGREQRINLWFDPAKDYHEYGFMWNQNLVLFHVDKMVIRVFKNQRDIGVNYLDYQPMNLYSSIWNGDSWATRGGQDKINWASAPFEASFTAFNVTNSCQVKNMTNYDEFHACYGKLYQSLYGQGSSLFLSRKQITQLRRIKRKYLIYDYCTDLNGLGGQVPKECARNWP